MGVDILEMLSKMTGKNQLGVNDPTGDNPAQTSELGRQFLAAEGAGPKAAGTQLAALAARSTKSSAGNYS